MPPKADPTTGGLSEYGQLFFESSTANTSRSMTTECTVTVQQKLFKDDDVYQNDYITATNQDSWYCGDENNSYTIAVSYTHLRAHET